MELKRAGFLYVTEVKLMSIHIIIQNNFRMLDVLLMAITKKTMPVNNGYTVDYHSAIEKKEALPL